jgi:cell division protein FtsN
MEEPVSWKGQTFTLLVFGGIVVLCSIFFVLGMLVGRDQGQRIAQLAAVEAAKPPIAAQAEPEPLNFFEQTTKEKPQLDLLPPPPPVVKEAPKQPEPPPEAPAPQKYFLQIFATKDAKAADRELTKVKSKDFRALILSPRPGEKDPQFRVHVGPYDSIAEAEMAKKELQAQGYKDVFRK